MRQYTISGIEHIIKLLNQYPQLLSLSSLAPIKEIGKRAQEAVAKSGCGCSAGPIYAQNRSTFERALEMMANGDHLLVKNVLKIDKLCYYAKDSAGINRLKCI